MVSEFFVSQHAHVHGETKGGSVCYARERFQSDVEEGPEAEVLTESGTARAEEATAGMVPATGAMELEQQQPEVVSAATRITEVLPLPRVDRGAAPKTPAVRPEPPSTVTTSASACLK